MPSATRQGLNVGLSQNGEVPEMVSAQVSSILPILLGDPHEMGQHLGKNVASEEQNE